jgi:methylated-DNA-protein-cysteine methyltransferase-like protein
VARRVRRPPRDAPILPARRTKEPSGSPRGNAYDRILAVVRRIPRGRVATYGQIAAAAGFPHAPRLAGYALHALPPGSPLPWHRVVGAGGRLSLARLSPDGALTQRMRLEREGVRFDARGRVDLAGCGWNGGRVRAPSGRR